VRWQDLKDLFKDGYNPLRADVMMDGYRSKGFGIVSFATLEEAERAVDEFKDSLLMDRPVIPVI
jgi:RNA recognition motif-containing protein